MSHATHPFVRAHPHTSGFVIKELLLLSRAIAASDPGETRGKLIARRDRLLTERLVFRLDGGFGARRHVAPIPPLVRDAEDRS